MKVSIMQPYFLPYIGYFQLIANTDNFIFFDVVKYNKKSWMNRNRILHPTNPEMSQYIRVPVSRHPSGSLISDIEINYSEKWKERIMGKLTVYKKLKAPFYYETTALLEDIFKNEHVYFCDLIIDSIDAINKYLGISVNFHKASNIDFPMDKIDSPGDWSLEISKHIKADEYINPYGGFKIFNENSFKNNRIKLNFLKPNLSEYGQSWRKNFYPGLSIVDVLMFNSRSEVMDTLYNDFMTFSKDDLTQKENK